MLRSMGSPRVGHNLAAAVRFIHSVMSDFATPWTEAHQASLSSTNSQSLFKLMSIESVMPSNHFMEKEMATHFSILAWEILWTEEPDRLQSVGLQRVRHN